MMKKIMLQLSVIMLSNSFLYADNQLFIDELKHQQVHFVNFLFSDLLGNIKEVCIPIDHVNQALANGIYFDGSSIQGCSKISQSDMLLKPDVTTTRVVPWLNGINKTAVIICDIWQDKNTPFAGDPRNTLKRVTQEVRAQGFTFNVGPELEFFILKNDHTPIDTQAYFTAQTDAKRAIQSNTLLYLLQQMKIDVEKLHHEVAHGQYEFSIKYGQPVEIADQIILAKYTLNTVLHDFGYKPTFMPKPFADQNGSAMHIHFSLWDNLENKNAFYDASDNLQLSKIGKQFFAGILHHIPSLSIIFNPTINSYKRLVPGYEAPVYICWGTKNRSALIRVPETDSPNGVRGELRCPDPLCNPYLAFTALLKSGFDGIIHGHETPNPMEINLYKMSDEERKKTDVNSLPVSLELALTSFKTSAFAQTAFDEQLVQNFIALKEKEVRAYNRHVSEWELTTYR
jgi:glutamine synthetase